LPSILEKLWLGRKATKKQMKKEKDPFKKAVLNGK
jgi:DNA polymerase elongation subunit (family B)